VWCDTSSDQPIQELAGAVGWIGSEAFGLEFKSPRAEAKAKFAENVAGVVGA